MSARRSPSHWRVAAGDDGTACRCRSTGDRTSCIADRHGRIHRLSAIAWHQQELLDALLADLHDSNSANYQRWLEPSDFLSRFGPSTADLVSVKQSLTAHGFTIIRENAHGVRVQGPASAVSDKAFGVPVQRRTQNAHTRFVAKGVMQMPGELAGLNVRVVGLEGLPEHQVHSRVTGPAMNTPDNRYGATGPYWFDDLKQAYDYPAYSKNTNGSGVSAAVLMEDLLFPGDVAAAFNHELFSTITVVPVPAVTTVMVNGGGAVGGPGTFEASLDVQQILGGAPGANVTLVSIPNLSDANILDGYAYIIDQNTFDLVNSSFGQCELEYTAPYNAGTDYTFILQEYHELFQQGIAQGITFSVSSGDQGGIMCPSPDYGFPNATNVAFGLGVSSPADDPGRHRRWRRQFDHHLQGGKSQLRLCQRKRFRRHGYSLRYFRGGTARERRCLGRRRWHQPDL